MSDTTTTQDATVAAATFSILGQTVREAQRTLETFATPPGVHSVTLTSDEVTALCPVTGQPDQYVVAITLLGAPRCVESKSLKLYLWSFREEGHFCEALAARIAQDVADATGAPRVGVRVTQKPRGGISIVADAMRGEQA